MADPLRLGRQPGEPAALHQGEGDPESDLLRTFVALAETLSFTQAAARLQLSQPTVSHHLKVLHEAGLLDRDKRGVWVYYRARPEALAAISDLFRTEGLTPAASA